MPRARILAVDDQLYFRVFLEDLLTQEGYDVRTAAGGEEALGLFEAEDFDVVLTDLVMPGVDGIQLVERVKALRPDQDVVVVTSVGDVRTAVDAMKLGATDYLLKPIDRTVLSRALGRVRERRRLRQEHERLMAENLEFMGAFSLYERGLGLFSTFSLDVLADRAAESLCLETHAHGAVLWLAREADPRRLRLAAVRGLVRPDEEPQEIALDALPAQISPLADPQRGSFLEGEDGGAEGGAGRRAPLWVAIRRGGQLLGAARLTDRLDGGEFGDAQRAAAEKLASFAAQAVENALRFRSLERRSFRDPATKAYTRAYFDDVAHNELRKAARFGRTFSLVRLELEGIGAWRERASAGEYAARLQALASHVGRALRATDLLAAESESRFCVLLPETDSLGAAVLKRRVRAALERSDDLRGLEPAERPEILLASATFPTDGSQLDALWSALEAGIDDDRRSLVRSLELESAPFRGIADTLLAEGVAGRPETGEQMTRFLLDEVARRPHERGLLFVAPGAGMAGALRDGLEALRGLSPRTEIVLVAERKGAPVSGLPVTWVSPLRAGTAAPFLIYFGEGAPYALIREPGSDEGRTTFFHTCDRVLVEHMTFQLGRDLGIPVGE
jgi:FixJ family two-component response regulator/GGDEF domain-containing protein